ncbi:MAG TPA: HlyD family secretion protein, partial [Hellea balneolensis]|nr:HlyD family secretion protein [Hellea balneolensis]
MRTLTPQSPLNKMPAQKTPAPKIVVTNTAQNTQTGDESASLLHKILSFETEIFNAVDRRSLKHIAVNKPRTLLPVGHIFLCTWSGHHPHIQAISNQAIVNNQAPFVQWLCHILKNMAKGQTKARTKKYDHKPAPKNGFDKGFTFTLETRRDDDDFDYPFAHAYWAPFAPKPDMGGMLFTRETPWLDAEKPVLDRIGLITGISWSALQKTKKKAFTTNRKLVLSGAMITALLVMLLPVPISTLAPAEIIADAPFIVTAPIDGVIDNIQVKPGSFVTKGTILATLNDTRFRNEYAIAGEEKSVAQARYRQASLSSFIDERSKHDLAITQAEQELASARETFAQDRLAKTVLVAARDGLIIYSDEKDWAGRPVAIGEKIMQIADPARVLLRIESPVADSGTLRSGARVRMFLDAAPLTPLKATL